MILPYAFPAAGEAIVNVNVSVLLHDYRLSSRRCPTMGFVTESRLLFSEAQSYQPREQTDAQTGCPGRMNKVI